AEDFRIRPEPDRGATPILDCAKVLQWAVRLTARIGLPVELLPARHLDLEMLRQGIHHRDANAMQAAARVIDLRVELSARMQRGHDDFERGLLLEFGMGVDRNASAVVGDAEEAILLEAHLDA